MSGECAIIDHNKVVFFHDSAQFVTHFPREARSSGVTTCVGFPELIAAVEVTGEQ